MSHDSLALLTDLYQLTMSYGYWIHGKSEQLSVFHLFFRKNPFAGGYAIAAGLESALEYMQNFRFSAEDVNYLATIPGNDGKPIFEKGFLDYLRELKLTVDLEAIPEGTVVFPHTLSYVHVADWWHKPIEPEFSIGSRLVIVYGRAGSEEAPCGVSYYQWEQREFRLVRFEPYDCGKQNEQ